MSIFLGTYYNDNDNDYGDNYYWREKRDIMEQISANPNLDIDYALLNLNHYNDILCMDGISRNPNLKPYHILNNPSLNWNWRFIAESNSLTIDMIQCMLYFRIHNNDVWRAVSCNSNITMDMIWNHPTIPWKWDGICSNCNLTMEMLLSYVNKEIVFRDSIYYENGDIVISKNDMKYISGFNKITIEDIIEHQEFDWYWKNVNKNKIITPKIAEAFNWEWNDAESFNWEWLYGNDENLVLSKNNFPLDWKKSLSNTNLTIQYILDNKEYLKEDLEVNLLKIILNTSIKISDIENNFDLAQILNTSIKNSDVEIFDLPQRRLRDAFKSRENFMNYKNHESNLCINDVDNVLCSNVFPKYYTEYTKDYDYGDSYSSIYSDDEYDWEKNNDEDFEMFRTDCHKSIYKVLFVNDRQNYVEFPTKNILCISMLDYLYNVENYGEGECVLSDVDFVLGNDYNLSKILSY